jgi:hypothetical protein
MLGGASWSARFDFCSTDSSYRSGPPLKPASSAANPNLTPMNSYTRIVHLRANFESVVSAAGTAMAPDKTEHSRSYTRCLTGAPHPLANLVVPGEQTPEEFNALLADTERWARAHQRPVALALFPGIGQPERPAWAEARGWQVLDNMPGMWLERPDEFNVGALPAGVTVSHAEEPGALPLTFSTQPSARIPRQISSSFGFNAAPRAA